MAIQVGAWAKEALVAITAQAGAEVAFAALTNTIDIDPGEKGFESIPMLNGGRVLKFAPHTDITVTMEAYFLDAGTDSGASGKSFWDLVHTQDTSQPVQVSVDRTRTKYRLAIMWVDSTSITDAAAQVVTPTNRALRFVASDGYFTSVKPSYTDKHLKFTVAFKVPPFDTSASANVKIESVSGSATATMGS